MTEQEKAIIGGEAKKVADTLRYAAPEMWVRHIVDAMLGAYDLGKKSGKEEAPR